MHEACEEARHGNMSLRQKVRQIGNKFLTHVEICAEEAAYLVLHMPLRSSSRTDVFINTNEPRKRAFLLKPVETLQDLPENSTNIESDNWIKRYQKRPKRLQTCCLADFISKFDMILPAKAKTSSYNQDLLPEDEIEEINEDDILHGEKDDGIFQEEYLMKDGSILKRRNTSKVIRHVRFNKDQASENYFREQLMLFYPWRNDELDLIGAFNSFEDNFKQNEETIQRNKKQYEADKRVIYIVEASMLYLTEDSNNVIAAEVQHEDGIDQEQDEDIRKLHGCFSPEYFGKDYDLGIDLGITRKQLERNDIVRKQMPESDYQNLVRSLNERQRNFFYHISHKVKMDHFPCYCFLTGVAGVGKSLLTTCLYQAVTRYYTKQPGENLDAVKTVLCAPTRKAAYNIGGQTIHSLFCIPANQKMNYKPLDAQQLDTRRVKFQNLKIIFIDKISMVGNKMFDFVNLRLQEIFTRNIPFGGVSIIAIGDLFQLEPVFDGWIFESLVDGYAPLAVNLWTELFGVFK